MKDKKITIIGPGAVGKTLGFLLNKNGYSISAVAGRSVKSVEEGINFIGNGKGFERPELAAKAGDIILLTVPDDSIKKVCDKISSKDGFKKGKIVCHCSGNLSADILKSAKDAGAKVASIHPLKSFAKPKKVIEDFEGTFCFLDGDVEILDKLKILVKNIGGFPKTISSENKHLYHAAAVIFSNYLVTLIHSGIKIFEKIGIEEEETKQAVFPLIEGTIDNVKKIKSFKALTGPIARGDIETVKTHIESFKKIIPEFLPLYCTLGKYTVDIGVKKGSLPEQKAKLILEMFE